MSESPTSTAPSGRPLPPVSGRSEAQVRGTACVHCGIILDNATAVDLGVQPLRRAGSVTSWFPRACPPCGLAS